MSVTTLLSLSGVPGLEAGVSLLTATYQGIENVKVYKQQCQDMSARCVSLLVALQEPKGLDGTMIQDIADELELIISRIDRRVKEWGSWSRLKSFLQQREIKDGIDRLHRDIDAAMMKFNIQMKMEMGRGYIESKAIQERDNAEIREVLQIIVKSTDDMKALLNMEHSRDSRPVEEMMEILQTQLMDPHLQAPQEESFKAGLWTLHEKTSKLPPLTDLTGQITLISYTPVLTGNYNDVFKGRWLDEEPVALRLPKALANSPEVQDVRYLYSFRGYCGKPPLSDLNGKLRSGENWTIPTLSLSMALYTWRINCILSVPGWTTVTLSSMLKDRHLRIV